MDFAALNNHLFVIADLFAVRQTAPGKTTFIPQTPRPTDALLLFAGTQGICYEQGRAPLTVPQGSLVYMPKGSRYIWENEPADGNSKQEQYLLEFTLYEWPFLRDATEKRAFFPSPPTQERLSFGEHVHIVATRHRELYKQLFSAAVDAFSRGQALAVYSAVYTIFQTLSQNRFLEEKHTADSALWEAVKNSAAYLESRREPYKSVAEIAAECHISISYYERLFSAVWGMPPTDYRNAFRISHIKKLLHSRATLEEIAQDVGFCDSSYLCRFFKKKTGMTPAEYRTLYRKQLCRYADFLPE